MLLSVVATCVGDAAQRVSHTLARTSADVLVQQDRHGEMLEYGNQTWQKPALHQSSGGGPSMEVDDRKQRPARAQGLCADFHGFGFGLAWTGSPGGLLSDLTGAPAGGGGGGLASAQRKSTT